MSKHIDGKFSCGKIKQDLNMIQIVAAKPNPAGKDRFDGVVETSASQVASEWIDLKNANFLHAFNLKGARICKAKEDDSWEDVYSFPDDIDYELGPEKTLRLHSGKVIEISHLFEIDKFGADEHAFTQKSYVWSNKKGEKIAIFSGDGGKLDETFYEPYPPEGEILERNDNGKLVFVYREYR